MQTLFRLATVIGSSETRRVIEPSNVAPFALRMIAGASHFFEVWTDLEQDDGKPAGPYMVRMRYDWPLDNGNQPEKLGAKTFDIEVGGVLVEGAKLYGYRFPIALDKGTHCIRSRFANSSATVDVNLELLEAEPVNPAEPMIDVEQYKGFFVRAPAESLKAERSEFEIENVDGSRTKRGGFNAAAAWADPGKYERAVTHSSGKLWRVNVKPVTLNEVPVGSDLAPYLVNGARLKLGAGVYTLSRSVNVRDVIVVGAGAVTVIKWTGADTYPGTVTPVTLIQASNSAFWRFEIDSTRRYGGSDPAGSDKWKLEKEQRPRCFALDDDCVVRQVSMIDFNRGCALGGGKARRLIQECWFSQNTRTYCIWFEGSDVSIYGNQAINSIFEHIARGGPSDPAQVYGWEFVAIDSNEFTNADNRPADPQDDGKGTIVMQAGRYGYRRNNKLTGAGGPSGVGPLSVGAGAPAHQRTTCVVIDSDLVARPVEIWPGAENVLVIDTPIAPRAPHELTGPKADPRRIVGLKTTYALTLEQQRVINTPALS